MRRDSGSSEAPSVEALRPEPVSIQILKAERGVQVMRDGIPFYDLQISMFSILLVCFGQNGTADCMCEPLATAACVYIDRVQPDMAAVHDAEPGCDHASVDFDACYDCLLRNCFEHRGNDAAQRRIRCTVQTEQRRDPFVRDAVLKKYNHIVRIDDKGGQTGISAVVFIFGGNRLIRMEILKVHCHNLGCVLNFIAALIKKLIKGWIEERADFEDRRSVVVRIDFFAVGDLLLNRDQGCADLSDTVGAMCIIVRKTNQPSVV